MIGREVVRCLRAGHRHCWCKTPLLRYRGCNLDVLGTTDAAEAIACIPPFIAEEA
jgi:hypothetical protein